MKKLRLAHKISIITVILIIFSLIISTYISSKWYINQMLNNIKLNTLNTVVISAKSPIIINGLKSKNDDGSIQKFISETQESLTQIDVMVVADINGIRYGHTVSDRVGEYFSADDNKNAIKYGETYVSIGPGTLGDSLRAFTPVKDEKGNIIGFVMAGTLLDSIENAKKTIFLMTLGFISLGGLIGILGAIFLSKYIKKSLLSYEPEDISRLYLENKGILETIHEGIIAIDTDYNITLINDTAKSYLNIKNYMNKKIQDAFPLSKLPEVIQNNIPIYDVQYALLDKIVISNNIPIIDTNGKTIGGVSSFRDQTEMNKLAEDITGFNKIVDSLRATTHEFKNKLHVILGMIETNQISNAKQYIGEINENLQATVSSILNCVLDPTLSALLIGKSQSCHELLIEWKLDEDTYFLNKDNYDVNSLVIIVGNLIDNAMEHLNKIKITNKNIYVYINDESKDLIITVKDNGNGIKDKELIFNKGFTTKEGSRGYGLYLTKQQVEKYNGSIDIDTNENGSNFTITLRKKEI